MSIKIENNAWGRLAASITDTDTTIPLIDASLFPVIGVDEYFFATLVNTSNELEIVKVTAIVGNDLTVERGAEGTLARGYTQNDLIEQRVTAQTVYDLFTENSQDAAAAQTAAEQAASDAEDAKNEVFNLIPNPQTGDSTKILQVNSAEDAYELVINSGGSGVPLTVSGGSGGIVQWGGVNQVGSSLPIPGAGFPAITAMKSLSAAVTNQLRVAYFDGSIQELRAYEWNGTSFILQGSVLPIGGSGNAAIATISENRVAFYGTAAEQLRMYEFNGSIWTLIGSGLPIIGAGTPSLCGLTSTDVAYHDTTIDELRLYRFNGSTWTLIGSGLPVTNTTNQAQMARLSDNRIAWYDSLNGRLRVYDFDGLSWTEFFSDDPDFQGDATITALNSTDIALYSPTTAFATVYRFTGTDFTFPENSAGWITGNLAGSINPRWTTLTSPSDPEVYLAYFDTNYDELKMLLWDAAGVGGYSKDNIGKISFVSDDVILADGLDPDEVVVFFPEIDRRNYAVNGDFFLRTIQGGSILNVVNDQYVTDFWQFKYFEDGGTINAPVQVQFRTLGSQGDITPRFYGGSYEMAFSAGITNPGPTAYIKMLHRIEGIPPIGNIGGKATISFWVQGTIAGDIGVLVRQTYGPPFGILNVVTHQTIVSVPGGTDWASYSITDVFSNQAQTVDSNSNVSIEFYVKNGAANNAPLGNGLPEVDYAGELTIASVQLFASGIGASVGVTNNSYNYDEPNRAAQQDEALRHFQRVRKESLNVITGYADTATSARCESITLQVPMRVTPTVTQYLGGTPTPWLLTFGERFSSGGQIVPDGDLQVQAFGNNSLRLSVVNTSGLNLDEYYGWIYAFTGELYCDARYYTTELN
jgi:hypothetical protein